MEHGVPVPHRVGANRYTMYVYYQLILALPNNMIKYQTYLPAVQLYMFSIVLSYIDAVKLYDKISKCYPAALPFM